MTRVAVVILNYNGEHLLPKFLPSVINHSAEATIIVADNGSKDQSIAVLNKLFPQVHVIALEKNFGFCGGYNRALQQVDAEIVVLLNSDIEVTKGWLAPMITLLDSDTSIVAVQPKILSYNQKDTFEHAGAAGGYIDSLGYPFCRGRLFDHVEKDLGQYDDEQDIFWATGACMMIRKKTYNDFGGLDEYFFAHMEEIDLCWKIHRANQRVCYTGKSKVYHVGAGTLGYNNPFKVYLNFRNGLILIYKHLGSMEMMYKFPLRILLDWMAAFMFLTKGQTEGFKSVFKAHGDFVKDFKIHRAKRKEIHKLFPQYPITGIYSGWVILSYYLRRRKTIPVNSPR
jgi:GT2 family glycosyltransferase